MPSAPSNPVSAVLDGKLYVMGYWQDLSANVNSKILVYDPATDSWTAKTPLPSSAISSKGVPWRGDWWSIAAAATTGESAPKRIYVVFMQYVYMGSLPTLVYNPSTDSWSEAASAPTNRQGFGMATVNDKLYAIGGHNVNYPYPDDTYFTVSEWTQTEEYTPASYGTPDPTYQTVSPSSSPSESDSSPSISLPSSIASTTVHSQNPSEISMPPKQQPTASPAPTLSPSAPSPDYYGGGLNALSLILGAAVVASAVVLGIMVYLIKRKRQP